MKQRLAEAIKHWDHVAPVVRYPKNDTEFNQLAAELDELLNIVGDNEKHHLMGFLIWPTALYFSGLTPWVLHALGI